MPKIDVSPTQLKIILSLIETHLPDTTIWAYGSRATGSARPQSDLDLVAFASADQKKAVYNLKEAFEESDLPFIVDLFVWDTVPDEFRKNIERERVVLVGG
ncbi:nucleotidyltransferase family protein [Desulfovibrio sp. JC010]|uniref:nucleotidyltransferase family protein n=1 Tax=Desulfovibrio sp. JC010 TaxID=2593641 RepID=UPI0013D63223|nr:nucleotidyltransferase domain-containing protein [Desulfovibrio sp. JC010]NDV26847.1 nucleotidyltransferase domain-containing protein [Desulfovibrio sp. JC010]